MAIYGNHVVAGASHPREPLPQKCSPFLDAGDRLHTHAEQVFTIQPLESGLLEGVSSKTIARLTLKALSSSP